ncbi:MAG: hypothetical protein ACRCX2_32080 [Paraclostridium sp.]
MKSDFFNAVVVSTSCGTTTSNGLIQTGQEEFDIVKGFIMSNYISIFRKYGVIPSVKDVGHATLCDITNNGLCQKYGSAVTLLASDEVIFNLMSERRNVIRHFGQVCYNSQKLMFKDLYSDHTMIP